MKEFLVLPLLAGPASASLCSLGSAIFKGNWYCQAVKRISYKNVGSSGTYNRITSMDSATGQCGQTPQSFDGPIAPLDEDLSIHLRGPLVLKQFAVYKPAAAVKSKRDEDRAPEHVHRHAQYHQQKKREAEAPAPTAAPIEKRAVGDKVIATINGEVVSWDNKWAGGPAPETPVMVTATINDQIVSWLNDWNPGAAAPAPTPAAPAAPAPDPAPVRAPAAAAVPKPARLPGWRPRPQGVTSKGDWEQVAYYNMDNVTAEGMTFLNNMGGQGSGVFDTTFGNSLSFAARHAKSGAPEPEVWNGRLASNQEISIFSSKSCAEGNCGFVRPGSVAFEGFTGGSKAFVFEFQMPDDGTSGWNMNMPAIWSLNAQIPRVQQYGRCSCWTSGCGEVDIFEVLDSGNDRAKATIHKKIAGGSSDYFQRPVDRFLKLAMVMDGDFITIQEVGDDFDLDRVVPSERISQIADDRKVPPTIRQSIFRLASGN